MSKSYGRQPTTKPGKTLSAKHLKMQIKLDKKKISDHVRQAKQGIDVGYNTAHAKNHKKEVKDRIKYLKKVNKLKVKAAKK
jgi:hypothetical protein